MNDNPIKNINIKIKFIGPCSSNEIDINYKSSSD